MQILWCVDADGLHIRQSDADAIAVLQPAQLLQALSLLKTALRQLGDFCQHLTPIGVDAQMLEERIVPEPMLILYTSYIWYHRATEIKGETPDVGHDLGRIGVVDSLYRIKALAQCANLRGGIVEEVHQCLYLRRLDEWLVALHVDDHIGISGNLLYGLLNTIGTALVVGTGHHGLAAEGFHTREDTLIVGSHKYIVEHAADLLLHSLNHCLAAKHGQRLARKSR